MEREVLQENPASARGVGEAIVSLVSRQLPRQSVTVSA